MDKDLIKVLASEVTTQVSFQRLNELNKLSDYELLERIIMKDKNMNLIDQKTINEFYQHPETALELPSIKTQFNIAKNLLAMEIEYIKSILN